MLPNIKFSWHINISVEKPLFVIYSYKNVLFGFEFAKLIVINRLMLFLLSNVHSSWIDIILFFKYNDRQRNKRIQEFLCDKEIMDEI